MAHGGSHSAQYNLGYDDGYVAGYAQGQADYIASGPSDMEAGIVKEAQTIEQRRSGDVNRPDKGSFPGK